MTDGTVLPQGPLSVVPKTEPVPEGFFCFVIVIVVFKTILRGKKSPLEIDATRFLCLSYSACVILQLLLQICQESDSPEENPVLQKLQLLLLPQRRDNVSAIPGSIPDFLLQRTETGSPGIRTVGARWRCPARLRFPSPGAGPSRPARRAERGRQGVLRPPQHVPGGMRLRVPAVTFVSCGFKEPSIIS